MHHFKRLQPTLCAKTGDGGSGRAELKHYMIYQNAKIYTHNLPAHIGLGADSNSPSPPVVCPRVAGRSIAPLLLLVHLPEEQGGVVSLSICAFVYVYRRPSTVRLFSKSKANAEVQSRYPGAFTQWSTEAPSPCSNFLGITSSKLA